MTGRLRSTPFEVLVLVVALVAPSGCGGRTRDRAAEMGGSGATVGGDGGSAGHGGAGLTNGGASEASNAGAGSVAAGAAGSPECSDEGMACVADEDCCGPYQCWKQVDAPICVSGCSSSLSEDQCGAREHCVPIFGTTADSMKRYQGCRRAGTSCDSAIFCALPPASSAEPSGGCVLFSNSCIPDGWTETYSCSLLGCPSHD